MRLLAAVLCLTTLLPAQSKPAPPESLLFTNVNVIDTREGQVRRNLTVLVEQGRIRSIAHLGLIATGQGLHVVNATGKYLIPGLWDMHAHTAERRVTWSDKVIYPLYLANGVTAVRDMGGDSDLVEQRRQRLECGELLGPHLFVEKQVPRAAALAEDKDSVRTPPNSRRDSYMPVAADLNTPIPDSVAGYSGHRSNEQLSGILLQCSSQEQTLREQSLDALERRDLDSYSRLLERTIATYDPQKAWSLFLELSSRATWQVPTLIWSQTMANVDDPKFRSDPRLAYIPLHIRAQWDPGTLLQHLSQRQFAVIKHEAARDLEIANIMRRAGVQFMAGTDAPDPYVVPGFSLHDELELLVKSGFTPAQALQSATFNPALFMVKLDQYGVIENNHVADMVLLDGNPLDDIRNTRKISAVIFGGKYYPRADLDKMLQEAQSLAAKE